MIRISAPAKINLYLHVTGKRADGFHLLDSLAVFTQFGDELTATPAERFSLTIAGAFAQSLSAGEDNLVLKAARVLQEATGIKQAASFHLQKSIPVGSGVGGGSADAAAALRALAKLWKLSPDDPRLHEVAQRVGSDVPVCLRSASSHMQGVGEQVTQVKLPGRFWLILANPKKALLTADVFRCYAPPFSQAKPLPPLGSFHALVEALKAHNNDLEKPAILLMPAIGEMLEALCGLPDCRLARMSGSGATCFGIFENEASAIAAHAQFLLHYPQWWSVVTAVKDEEPA